MHSERIIISLFFVGVSRNAGLEVDSGERRVISSVSLEAEDVDTPPNQVFYFINAAPRFGNLQLKVRSRPVLFRSGCVIVRSVLTRATRPADGVGLDRAVGRSQLHSGRRGDEPPVVQTRRRLGRRLQGSRQLPLHPQRPGQRVSCSELLRVRPHCAERSEVRLGAGVNSHCSLTHKNLTDQFEPKEIFIHLSHELKLCGALS